MLKNVFIYLLGAGYLDIETRLLAAGADVNSSDMFRNTALILGKIGLFRDQIFFHIEFNYND